MEQVIIGVDPHKLSATIEVVDQHERLLGSGRFTTDRAGYAAMRKYAGSWPERVWAAGPPALLLAFGNLTEHQLIRGVNTIAEAVRRSKALGA